MMRYITCEECGLETDNMDYLILESHTKRLYCRTCGAYVGEYKIVHEKDNVISIMN